MKDCVLRRILNIGCLLLLTSVVMDSILWVTRRYMIPCWTMAAMSAGLIVLLQVLARFTLDVPRPGDV